MSITVDGVQDTDVGEISRCTTTEAANGGVRFATGKQEDIYLRQRWDNKLEVSDDKLERRYDYQGNRRSEYEWRRLKEAIVEICKDQEKAWYLQQFEKIDGTTYTEPTTTELAGFGSRVVARMLSPLYTFIGNVWKANP
ncbi:uncharacterized protein LOC144863349 [Branchiostoma floridae x Branchiostoma japonicum]